MFLFQNSTSILMPTPYLREGMQLWMFFRLFILIIISKCIIIYCLLGVCEFIFCQNIFMFIQLA